MKRLVAVLPLQQAMLWKFVFPAVSFLILCFAQANAQRSTALMQGDPDAAFAALKQTYSDLEAHPRFPTRLKRGDSYDLVNCHDFEEDDAGNEIKYLKSNPVISCLADVAAISTKLSRDLTTLGYPESVWGPVLKSYEDSALNRYKQQHGCSLQRPENADDIYSPKRLQRALNDYRRNVNRSLGAITFEGGCGAGDFAVKISTDPANGRVFFIPQFFYTLCRVQNIDPEDMNRCDRWHEAFNGSLNMVSGIYWYKATWPDGTVRKGQFNFDALSPDGESVENVTAHFRKQSQPAIVLRKP